MEVFRIEVQDRRNGEFKERTTVAAENGNAALKAYGLRGSRPYKGQARSNSGKTFRAVATGQKVTVA